MCKYQELQARHNKEMKQVPMAFAYMDKHFEEALVTLGVTKEEVLSIGGGGFIKKADEALLMSILDRHVIECEEARKDPQYCFDMFLYQLGNHEYCITHDDEPTIEACELTVEEVVNNPVLLDAYKEAKRYYMATCPDW